MIYCIYLDVVILCILSGPEVIAIWCIVIPIFICAHCKIVADPTGLVLFLETQLSERDAEEYPGSQVITQTKLLITPV